MKTFLRLSPLVALAVSALACSAAPLAPDAADEQSADETSGLVLPGLGRFDRTPPPTASGVPPMHEKACADTEVSAGLKLADRICKDSSAAGCMSDYGANCQTQDLEIFTGVSLGTGTGRNPAYNGHGGRGEQMAKAALCLLRDLRNGDVPNTVPLGAGASAYQRVGFLEYDPSARRVRGYRQLGFKLPLVGSLDLRAQAFSAELADWSHPYDDHAVHKLGSFRVTRGHALLMSMDDNHEWLDMTLGRISVVTPYGAIDVQPQVSFLSDAKVSTFPKSGAFVRTRVFDDRVTATTDVYGRFEGAKTLDTLPGYDYRGRAWSSQVGLGSRSYVDAWNPSSVTRPDLGVPPDYVSTPRNEVERTPGAEIRGGALISYDPSAMLPASMRGSPLKVTANLWVKPEVVASLHGQLGVFAAEASQNLDGKRSREMLAMPSDLFGSARMEIAYGFDLDVWVVTGFGDVKIVNLHPKGSTPIPIAEKSGEHRAAEVVMTDAEMGPNGKRTPWRYDRFQTLRGDSVADGKAWVDACLAAPAETRPLPAASYTPGSPQEMLAGEFPCNICVGNPEWTGVVNDTWATIPATSQTLYPSTTQAPWSCGQQSLGCMDLCAWNPATHELRVTRSQVTGDQYCARPR